MPSYNGVNIFGTSVRMATGVLNPAVQMNTFFGLSGVEKLSGGFRGRVTNVTGVLRGATAEELGAKERLFQSYADGLGRPLVDMYGFEWQDVTLESYNPVGRVLQDPYGVYYRNYQATFHHGT